MQLIMHTLRCLFCSSMGFFFRWMECLVLSDAVLQHAGSCHHVQGRA
jgi:hypothetical protein